MKPTLEGDESPRWSFMRVRKIRGRDGSVYLWRLYILSTPWFGVMLHRIFRPDRQRDLHGHPWNFLSILLRGYYRELIGDTVRQCEVERRWLNPKRAEDRHSITWVSRAPVWTLVFTGLRRRKWGFWIRSCPLHDGCTHEKTHERFVPYDQYERLNDA